MKICGFEKFSMVDYGDYITCTVFTEGCNFRCPFCHNSALVTGRDNAPISENEIFEYLDKRKKFVDAVCISGGEPTLQADLSEFIAKVKAKGFFVKLDTNGYTPDKLKSLINAGLVDYVAMDIKSSPEGYAAITDVKNLDISKILTSVDFIMTSGIDYEFRTTLVRGFHTEKEIKAIASWLKGAKRYFLQHFADKGSCIAQGLSEVPKYIALDYKRILSETIPVVELRGY